MYKLCATSARFGTAASEQSGSERDAAFEKGIGESGPLLTQTPTAQPGTATICDTQHFKTLTLDAPIPLWQPNMPHHPSIQHLLQKEGHGMIIQTVEITVLHAGFQSETRTDMMT